MENFKENIILINDLSSEKFKLRSPKGNKLYTEPHFNAFSKENLGSIPRNQENILIRDSDIQKKGFLSRSNRFKNIANYISNNPGPGMYELKNSSIIKNNFFSKAERFDTRKDFYDKFYPGPCDYSCSTNYSEKSHRFESLYISRNSISIKTNEESPGPGKYHKELPRKENSYNSVFLSKTKKFNLINNDNFEPGRYNKEYDLIKNPDKTSFFFKNKLPVLTNPVEEALNINKKEPIIPGPGAYNIIKDKIIKTSYRYENNIEIKQPIKEINNSIIQEVSESPRHINNVAKSSFDSKTKRIEDNKNHVPGPCYYKNVEKPKKKEQFLFNIEKKWV